MARTVDEIKVEIAEVAVKADAIVYAARSLAPRDRDASEALDEAREAFHLFMVKRADLVKELSKELAYSAGNKVTEIIEAAKEIDRSLEITFDERDRDALNRLDNALAPVVEAIRIARSIIGDLPV